MFIQTEVTEDPARLRFLPGRQVLPEGTAAFAGRDAASASPLAARLFDVEGVASLSFDTEAITVTKSGGEWQHLRPALLGVIMEHFISGAPVMREPVQPVARPVPEGMRGVADQIMQALHQVIDPELGYNIVDLGLVYDVFVDEEGTVLVTMTTTTPGCPATEYLVEGADRSASSVDGVAAVDVQLTYEPRWEPDMMSDAAKTHLGMA